MKLCSSCHILLRPHSTLVWWMKCPCCGFTGLYLDEIHPNKRELAQKNPMVTWDLCDSKNEHSSQFDTDPAPNKKYD